MAAVFGDFGEGRQQLEHSAHQDDAAGTVAKPLVIGQKDYAERGLHAMGRANKCRGELAQLTLIERWEAGQYLGMAFGIAADYEAMNRTEANFEPSRSEGRNEHRHGRLIAGVGQVVHRFGERVDQLASRGWAGAHRDRRWAQAS